ncbi:glycosyltransferase [Cohnella endophytica]|uniref:Glycosyltransferase n=1 Tax=Cohnella endophytica TaxID=2419778 RepID=A0A494XRE7_9BACL|nr:glycosyltransferase [Cohnella endophytica]RKP53195.1 glycosyltransferase [Cohnella endophytica]
MIKSKSILYICPENPFPPAGGDKIRIVNLLRLLSEHFEIDLLAYEPVARDEERQELNIPNNCRLHTVPSMDYKSWSLRLRSLILRRNNSLLSHADLHLSHRLKQLSERRQYDYVVVTHSFLGYLLPLLRALQPNSLLVTDAHNFETSLSRQFALTQTSMLRKTYFLLASHWNRKLEKEICKRTDLLLTTSEPDAEAFQSLSPSDKHKIKVIPNFVDMRSYESDRAENVTPRSPNIIFPGTMSYFPNVNGALYFGRKIYPILKAVIPDLTWHIVGRGIHPEVQALAESDSSIVVTGFVPDMGTYMRNASVVIAPLLEGGGTRLKILEAWAYGIPVVSTEKGAEGIVCENDRDICLADEPQAFADAILKLIRDRTFAAQIVSNARNQLLNLYERESVKERLLSLFMEERKEKTS